MKAGVLFLLYFCEDLAMIKSNAAVQTEVERSYEENLHENKTDKESPEHGACGTQKFIHCICGASPACYCGDGAADF